VQPWAARRIIDTAVPFHERALVLARHQPLLFAAGTP
jgi:hypothetical protein